MVHRRRGFEPNVSQSRWRGLPLVMHHKCFWANALQDGLFHALDAPGLAVWCCLWKVNFLNPKPPGFKIQDSRRNFLNQNYPFRLPSSSPKAWDSKSFPQNLESWIQKTLQSLQSFLDSRFKILGETFWIQIPLLDLHLLDSRFKILRETFWIPSLLDSRFKILGETFWIRIILSDFPHPDPRLGIQKVSLRILNLESRKLRKVCKVFCIQALRIVVFLFIYIYIKMCTCLHGHWGIKWIKAYKLWYFYLYIY